MPSVTPGLEGSSSERTLAAESKSCPDDEGSHFVARDGNVTSEISQRESPDTDSDPFPPTNEYSPSQREAIEARIHAKYGTRKSMTESQLYLDCDPAVDQIARETRPPAGPGRTAAWVASLRNEGLDEDDPLVSNASVTSANDIQIPKCEHLQILKRELIEVKVKETKLKMDIAALEKEIKAERGLKVVQQMIPKTRLCQKLQATTAEQRDPKIRESKGILTVCLAGTELTNDRICKLDNR